MWALILLCLALLISIFCDEPQAEGRTGGGQGGREDDIPKTFSIAAEWLDRPYFSALEAAGWTYVPRDTIQPGDKVGSLQKPPNKVGLEYRDGNYGYFHADPIPAFISYRISAQDISNKTKLHRILMASSARDCVAKTMQITTESAFPGGTWMIRAHAAHKGEASVAVNNRKDWTKYTSRFSSYKGHASTVIASEYIIEPLLFRGWKFHIRLALIVSDDGAGRSFYVSPDAMVATAAAKYVAEDWTDATIHDTHFGKTTVPILFSDAFPDEAPRLLEAARTTLRRALAVAGKGVKKYPDQLAGYEVFGVDIMFRADGTPVLIEINRNPYLGYYANPEVDPAAGKIVVDRYRQMVACGIFTAALPAGVRPPIPPDSAPVLLLQM